MSDDSSTAEMSSPRVGVKYAAFLSYSRQDDRVADWVHRSLEAYRTPRALLSEEGRFGPRPARLAPVFRDRTDMSSGGSLTEKLVVALRQSEFLIVLCSPASARSQYVNAEVETFLKHGSAERIFPVIVSGEPNSGDPATECLPSALRSLNLLASDLRDVRLKSGKRIGDGRAAGRAKLIAGLLDVSLDTITQRERQRANRRAALATAASLVFFALSVAAAAAGWIAIQNQREAERQTAIAQASSGFLVDIFEAGAPNQKNPNQFTARQILDLGARRIGSEFPDQPELKATLTGMISRAYLDLGAFESGISLAEAERESIDQADDEGVRALIVLARLYLADERGAEAEQTVNEALKRLGEKPEAAHALRAYALETRGAIFDFEQDLEAALHQYDLALEEQAKVSPADPTLSISTLSERALILTDLGRFDEADADLRTAREYAVTASGPDSLRVARIDQSLARNTLYAGDASEAKALIERAWITAARLLDPDNTSLADIQSLKGEIESALDDTAEAYAAFGKAISIFDSALGPLSPASAGTHYYLAAFQFDEKDYAAAWESLEAAETAFHSAKRPDVDNLNNVLGFRIELLSALGRAEQLAAMCTSELPKLAEAWGMDDVDYQRLDTICSDTQ